jgi:hypothetical protein
MNNLYVRCWNSRNLAYIPFMQLTITGNTLLMESPGQKAVMLSAFLSDGGGGGGGGVCQTTFLYQREIN